MVLTIKQEKISGVYKITNNITGDFYIGSSKNIKQRWYSHRDKIFWQRRPGMRLYQAFIKYGLDNFKFEVIEETVNLREREQYWIDLLKPNYNAIRANGFDIERYRELNRKDSKEYGNRLCLYEGETITLNALSLRFHRQGIAHSTLEAKKYILNE